jgi:hypothetical protein
MILQRLLLRPRLLAAALVAAQRPALLGLLVEAPQPL